MPVARYRAAARRLRNTGLRRTSVIASILRLWVRIPPGDTGCCLLWVLSGRGPCDEPIIHLEESYRLCSVVVWSRNIVIEETGVHRGWGGGGCCGTIKKIYLNVPCSSFIYSSVKSTISVRTITSRTADIRCERAWREYRPSDNAQTPLPICAAVNNSLAGHASQSCDWHVR